MDAGLEDSERADRGDRDGEGEEYGSWVRGFLIHSQGLIEGFCSRSPGSKLFVIGNNISVAGRYRQVPKSEHEARPQRGGSASQADPKYPGHDARRSRREAAASRVGREPGIGGENRSSTPLGCRLRAVHAGEGAGCADGAVVYRRQGSGAICRLSGFQTKLSPSCPR